MKRTERPSTRPGREEKKPHVAIKIDSTNELVVIAAAIAEPVARKRLLAGIPPDAFRARGHSEIWEALAELERRGLDYDPATVQQLSGGVAQAEALSALARERPKVPSNLAFHVDSLRWDKARADAVQGPLGALLEALQDQSSEPDRIRALAKQVGMAFDGHSGRTYMRDSSTLAREMMHSLQQRREGVGYYPFGLEGLDVYGKGEEREGRRRLVLGAAKKATSVVTGVTGSGKSAFAKAIAIAQAELGRRVLYGAWEVDALPTLEECAAARLGISRSDLNEGLVSDEDIRLMGEEAEKIGAMIRFVDVPFGRKTGERMLNDRNLDVIHQLIADSGAEFCIFDLWRRAVRQFDPDEEENALYRQQSIAKETNTHCMLVHQQRFKDIEMRKDKRPTREGLKGSGAWVEVPDVIFGVHMPALWKDVANDRIEVFILKQRQGPWPLAVEFDFNPESGVFSNGRGMRYERPDEVSEPQEFKERSERPISGGKRGRAA